MLMFNGTNDPVVNYNGVPTLSSARATAEFWSIRNGCSAGYEDSNLPNIAPNDGTTVSLRRYRSCVDSEVRLYTINGGGHTWPGTTYAGYTIALGSTTFDIDATLALLSPGVTLVSDGGPTRHAARQHSALDLMLASFGDGLKSLAAAGESQRPRPRAVEATLTDAERAEAAALMRINHAGEVAAQGLYHGQALMARDPQVRQQMLDAAREADSARIFIGSENRLFSLSGSSVIAAPWRDGDGRVVGVVGVIGPDRKTHV